MGLKARGTVNEGMGEGVVEGECRRGVGMKARGRGNEGKGEGE